MNKKTPPKPVSAPAANRSRPSRGVTREMWDTFDLPDTHLPNTDALDLLAKNNGWHKGLARSHYKQWLAAGGKGATPPGPPLKEKKAAVPRPSLAAHQQLAIDLNGNLQKRTVLTLEATKAVPAKAAAVQGPPRPLRVCTKCGGEEHRPSGKCSFCNSPEMRDAMPGEVVPPPRMFVAIGQGCWGLGMNPEKAGAEMLAHWPLFIPRKGAQVQLWDAPRSAYVNQQGKIAWNSSDPAPVLVLDKILP